MIADIFVTVKGGREDLSVRSLRSLSSCTDRSQYRLTVCCDGTQLFEGQEAGRFIDVILGELKADYLLQSRENEGLGPTINRAIASIQSINDWYSHPTHGDPSKVAPLVCMLQDDILYSPGWLMRLANVFMANEHLYKLGFASGIECVEHPVKKVIVPGQIVLKDWIRATCMMGRREYWQSMMPIPRLDPETGRIRAKPNDGMGSGVDWWLIRNHERSVVRSGKTCLVMPGLLQHIGYDRSTWLKREMPESDSDKEKMREKFEGEF